MCVWGGDHVCGDRGDYVVLGLQGHEGGRGGGNMWMMRWWLVLLLLLLAAGDVLSL